MLVINLLEQIFFFNIGPANRDDTYFEWRNENFNKPTLFEIKFARRAPIKDLFFCISKVDEKIVYYHHSETDTVFSIGSRTEVQSQLLEALIEHLIENFFYTFDKSLLQTCYGDQCDIFSSFQEIVENSFINYEKLNLIKIVLVTCKGCKKTIPVVIKKTLVEKSQKSNTPLVYSHSGHAVLIYIDKQFQIRGDEIVGVSY